MNIRSPQNRDPIRWLALLLPILAAALSFGLVAGEDAARSRLTASPPASVSAFTRQHCLGCHDAEVQKGGLNLQAILGDEVSGHVAEWEKVVRRLRTRQMPPPDKSRPTEPEYAAALSQLETALDQAAASRPDPGRSESLRRLTRTEYQNAIRDLLDLEIDAAALLPKEDAGHGFDNVTVATLSPTLLDRYLSAARKISRLAVGTPQRVTGDTMRVRPDLTQEEHVEGLPLGTRGGVLISHTFPEDAQYEIQIRLARDRNEEVEGLREPHEVVVLLDREPVATFTVAPPEGHRNFALVDQHLKARLPVRAGPHQLGVTFVKNPSVLLETRRQPGPARFNMHRHPRLGPAVFQVSINGPYDSRGPGDTPSRRRIFIARPTRPTEEDACARRILAALARRAYRRPVVSADLKAPMQLYRAARRERGFEAGIEAGIEAGLSAILANPNFLLRIERDPPGVPPGTPYALDDLALASRLSFFLWSSIPDEPLLALAERGELRRPEVLERETRRLLADPRAGSLARNFADQWLYLRNLESLSPDARLFPDFDDNLRQAFRRETELFFEAFLREDRGVDALLGAHATYLNERLARHYGVPHVYGSRFRRVVAREAGRGGLLRHGSVLAVTSYADRTSPVLRGKWVLENLLGTPPPPPLPNVPALKDNTISATLSVRERLAEHRANAACAGCHRLIDPPGFALEDFDAVGRRRILEEGRPVDASGGLPDGSVFSGVGGLETALLRRPEILATTLTEKLLTFALGRGLTPTDAPAVRAIVRKASREDWRISAILVGITQSPLFTQRRSP